MTSAYLPAQLVKYTSCEAGDHSCECGGGEPGEEAGGEYPAYGVSISQPARNSEELEECVGPEKSGEERAEISGG